MEDISLMIGDVRFNYRVAVLFEHNGKFLFQKGEKNSYWSLIGGRVKSGESSYDALIREVKEELEIDLLRKNIKLIYIAENFFKVNETQTHEMLFIFKVDIIDSRLYDNQDFKPVDRNDINLHWFTQEEIKELNIQPNIVKNILNRESLSHEIIID